MHLTLTLSAKKVAIVLSITIIVLTAISTAIQWGKYVFDYRESWTRMFNLDREMNIPTWYSAMMLAGCGVMLKAIAAEKKRLMTATPDVGGC